MQLDIMFIISLTDARYDCILMNLFYNNWEIFQKSLIRKVYILKIWILTPLISFHQTCKNPQFNFSSLRKLYPFETNTSTISIVFAESASSLITNYKKEKIHGIAPNSKNPRSGMQTESHVKSVIHVPFVNTFPLYTRSQGYTWSK